MAITTCKECKKELSTKATTCPHCGAKIRRTSLITWLIAIIIVPSIFIGIFNSSSNPPPTTPAKTAEQLAADAKQDALLNIGAIGARALKNSMKDPEAFVLSSAVVLETGTTCYDYRAKNSFGAVLPSHAILVSSGKILSQEQDGNAFVLAWNKECTKGGGRDIAGALNRLGLL